MHVCLKTKLNVLCQDNGQTITLVKVTNGLPLSIKTNQFIQELELDTQLKLKNDQKLHAIVAYGEDIYVYSLHVDQQDAEQQYQKLLTMGDKTFSLTEVTYKQSN